MLRKDDHITLNPLFDELYTSVEDQLADIWQEEDSIIIKAQRSIDIVRISLDELRNSIVGYTFDNKQEEINFFKNIKPRFYSRLIYFLKVLRIETRRPTGAFDTEATYLQKELCRLTYYFEGNLEFYQYYRTGSTYLDEIYFLRSTPDIYFALDEYYFSSDPGFSTTHDHKVAKILANEMLRIYLNKALEELQGKKEDAILNPNGKTSLQWTGSKTSLIELLYALQSAGVFNQGNADVKQIAGFFQKTFSVNLGNYYRTFQEIRIRKKTRTQFLDQLTEKLIKRMDESDENYRA